MKLFLPPRVHEARVAFTCMSWPVSRDSVTEWLLLLLLFLLLLQTSSSKRDDGNGGLPAQQAVSACSVELFGSVMETMAISLGQPKCRVSACRVAFF